jgi:preprotein translocase subunit SecF
MNYFRYLNAYLIFSSIVVGLSVVSIAVFGLNLGIEFTGGSIMEVEYQTDRPSNQEISKQLEGFDLGAPSIQPIGENGVIIRMKDLSEDVHQAVREKLCAGAKEIRFESIGPVIGK